MWTLKSDVQQTLRHTAPILKKLNACKKIPPSVLHTMTQMITISTPTVQVLIYRIRSHYFSATISSLFNDKRHLHAEVHS